MVWWCLYKLFIVDTFSSIHTVNPANQLQTAYLAWGTESGISLGFSLSVLIRNRLEARRTFKVQFDSSHISDTKPREDILCQFYFFVITPLR